MKIVKRLVGNFVAHGLPRFLLVISFAGSFEKAQSFLVRKRVSPRKFGQALHGFLGCSSKDLSKDFSSITLDLSIIESVSSCFRQEF